MGSAGRGARVRSLAFFTLLLLLSSAVPVLADPAGRPEEEIAWASEEEERLLPSGEDIARGLRELEEQEAGRKRWRESPEAEAQRELSRSAYSELAAAEVEALLRSSFTAQLGQIDRDPARALSDVALERVLGPTEALVDLGGRTVLMEGTTPVRARGADGDLAKLSLELERAGGDFRPVNPLVDLALPERASGEIELGDEGLAVSPELAAASARRLGDKDLLYPEAATDTDLLSQPISSGVELSYQLRSPASPQRFAIDLDLPAGGSLAADGDGAAISREGVRLATVSAPRAFDAQGEAVPARLRVESGGLAIEIPHREGEFAYPILLDPAIYENWYDSNNNWYNGNNLDDLEAAAGIWVWQTNNGGRFWAGTTHWVHDFGGSDRGLFIAATSSGSSQSANKFGQWTYTVPDPPDTTWIAAAGASPFWRYNDSCSASSYPEPHDFAGIWSLQWSPEYGWVTFAKDDANNSGHTYHTAPENWKEKTGEVFILGMGTGSGAGPIPCWRETYAGGVYVWLDDAENPSIGTPSGAPGGWFSDETQFSLEVPVSDGGLGVQNTTLAPQGTSVIYDIAPQEQCSGLKADPCPNSTTADFALDGDLFKEGERSAQLSATDPTGKVSATAQWTSKVDLTPPTVTLDGQLAEITEEDEGEEQGNEEVETLSLPVYNLKIEAEDGSNAEGKTKRSGLKDIEIHLDGDEAAESVPWEAQSCPQSSCAMNVTYSLQLTDLEAGGHTLEVIAIDQVGKERKRNIEFEYVPATGIKDEYVMHYFPLPDGQGNEEEEEFPARPELAVNVINGNLVYRERDIDVEGSALDLEVERYYNSMLPEQDDSEWGDGWTLAQTPTLEPEEGEGEAPPAEATVLSTTSALEDEVALPAESGEGEFDPELQATLTKTAQGYELSDESGESESTLSFDQSGKVTEMDTGGYAQIDYGYEGGALAEIAVDDPASADGGPAEEGEEEASEEPGPYTDVLYGASVGSEGAEGGELQAPSDVAIDAEGNLWVADTGNDRIEKFDAEGEFLSQFGASGSGEGELSEPSALAIDDEGDIWVVDTGNDRLQKFSPEGEYLTGFGEEGSGEGQLLTPRDIAIDDEGDIWVSESSAARVQEFSPEGEYLGKIGTFLGYPATGFDLDPEGDVWIAIGFGCLAKRSVDNTFLDYRCGLGPPASLDVDGDGNIWIGDKENDRVELFDSAGQYVLEFGEAGSEDGQFELESPIGIAADAAHGLWITDAGNDRLQKWVAGSYVPDEEEPEPAPDDPRVDLTLSEGLVDSVVGEEAGTHEYAHEGELLIAHDGPLGETAYEYDEDERLSKVTLPNGTWGAVAYFDDGRVKSVTVSEEGGEAKTTSFEYSDEPRRTVVDPPDFPTVTYEIGADGSVLKWSNAQEPPVIDDISGSFYANRETETPIPAGDHVLSIQAYSPFGIASIELIADGTDLIDESLCDTEETPEECETLAHEWVTNTGNWAPGIAQFEVLVTDGEGRSASENFWVNMPKPPPPPAQGTPVPPTYQEVADFRKEYGLEVVFPVKDQTELNERIFDLIGAWHNPQTPAGEVARASRSKWGVPLRPSDVAEMEFREAYVAQAGEAIPEWAEANHPDTYAGYWIDHRQGGKVRIGFTENQPNAVSQLRPLLTAPENRVIEFSFQPTRSLDTLSDNEESLLLSLKSEPSVDALVTRTESSIPTNEVAIGATNVSSLTNYIDSNFGANSPYSVFYAPEFASKRDRTRPLSHNLWGGDWIRGHDEEGLVSCSLGFGATEVRYKKFNGDRINDKFALTAGHCFLKNTSVKQAYPLGGSEYEERALGPVWRRTFLQEFGDFVSDGEIIKLTHGHTPPRRIYLANNTEFAPVKGTEKMSVGSTLCTSGITTGVTVCGAAKGPFRVRYGGGVSEWVVATNARTDYGDSGGTVWNAGNGKAVGLVASGPSKTPSETWFSPMRPAQAPDGDKIPGLLELLDGKGPKAVGPLLIAKLP